MDAATSGRPRPDRALPLGLAGMLVVVAAVEWVAAGHARELAIYQALGARFAANAAASAAPGCDVLALGDSQIKLGFDPEAFERVSGRTAVNLAVPGTPPPVTFAVLKRALAAGARPRAVVIGHMTLGGNPRDNLNVFSELLGPGEAFELAHASRDPALLASVLTRRALPSLRYREGIRAALTGRASAGTPGALAASFWEGWESHRGAQLHEADGRAGGRMEPGLERTLYSRPWGVHPVFEGYLRRTAGLAASRGIPVFWVIAPIVPEAQARRDALGHDARHTRNLRAVLSRTPNVTVLDARRAGFPASAFVDSCHLNRDGAARLTAEIARAVDDHLGRSSQKEGAPGWVALEYHEEPRDRLARDPDARPRR